MPDVARKALRVFLIGAATFGLTLGLLGPLVEDDFEVSVVAAVTAVGIVTSYELLKVARKSGRLAWHQVPPLWEPPREEPGAELPDALWEWEALVGAARSDQRAMDRLLRRMAPIAPDRESLQDLESSSGDEFDRRLEQFIEEARHG